MPRVIYYMVYTPIPAKISGVFSVVFGSTERRKPS